MEQLRIDLDVLTDEQDGPGVLGIELTAEQQAPVERRAESLLLSAAAGSGKTSVLVERFVRAVREDGVAPGAILAITFTERAAGELRSRARARLLALGDRQGARDTEAAFVGTFHGFCARLLRSHPLPAGLDPEFAILDAGQSGRLREVAFAQALAAFLEGEPPNAIDLVAAYGADGVRAMIEQIHAELRSRGQRRPRLPARRAAPGADPLELQAVAALALLDRLLELFCERFEALKAQRSALDFDDLELIAGELLAGNDGLRASWSERFALLMVDEFQDTNPRQLAILQALARENLFTVGDEHQSIYGFRHADVSLFRGRRAELARVGRSLALTRNFRSRGELLELVNTAFADRFADFSRLLEGREHAGGQAGGPPSVEPVVELLLSSNKGWQESETVAAAIASGLPHASIWRQAEAGLLAQRVHELVQAGQALPGEIVVLLRATGDIEVFERALQLRGLRTLATVGTFWGRQQIGDLHCYLRALANPRDEEALYSALASPLAGCSRDGLALLAKAASSSGRVWETALAVSEQPPSQLSDPDRHAVASFCEWLERERRDAPGLAISELVERVLAHSGYRAHVLALDWGERRLANVHKLLRLARSFEAREGRDLRAFVDHVEYLKRAEAIEPEAPVEGVEPDAVRLMTVHAAKGLEFPVVCVADLGRQPLLRSPKLLVEGDRVGLRLQRVGDGEVRPALEYEELRSERRRREAEEEDRVLYVAMTRARDRLLLSGAVDFESWPRPGEVPPPIQWLGPALCPTLAEVGQRGAGVHELAVGPSGAIALRCTLSTPAAYGSILREAPAAGAVSGPSAASRGAVACAPRPPSAVDARGAAAPAGVLTPTPTLTPTPALPATLSYTSFSQLERCGYRYYLERVLGMPEKPAAAAGAAAAGGLEARARGVLVHRLMESWEFSGGEPPDADRVGAVARELGLETTPGEREEIVRLLARALDGPLSRRIAAATRLRREHPFAFSLGEGAPLVTGVIDLLCEESDGTALIVDYKSDRLAPDADPEELLARDYAVQRLLYALAVLREGAVVAEVVHWFLERPEEPAVARYTLAELATLEDELAARLASAWSEPFAVSRRPHRALCLSCPGRSGLCSWSEQDTLREEPAAPAHAGGGPHAVNP
jgi:ATP-dependent exoDNAse (exonuclease V) beta subunit